MILVCIFKFDIRVEWMLLLYEKKAATGRKGTIRISRYQKMINLRPGREGCYQALSNRLVAGLDNVITRNTRGTRFSDKNFFQLFPIFFPV